MRRDAHLGKDTLGELACGEFSNVILSNDELSKLNQRFGRIAVRSLIDQLSSYMKSQSKDYPDHYATIIDWAKRKGVEEVHSTPVSPESPKLTPSEIAVSKRNIRKTREWLANAGVVVPDKEEA